MAAANLTQPWLTGFSVCSCGHLSQGGDGYGIPIVVEYRHELT